MIGQRLFEACEILLSLKDASMNKVMGFPDDLKLLSSMTLFEYILDESSIFTNIIEAYFDDERDENTLEIINVS